MCPQNPHKQKVIQRGGRYAAEFHCPETRIEPKAEWDERSAWFRRLHTEHLATVDAVDVGRHLAQGRNTLMIEVFHDVCPFEALAQTPGLLCEVEADFGGQTSILAATDATWEAAEITAWSRKSLKFNYQRGWMEQLDARRTLEEKSQPAIVLGKVGTAP